NAKLLPAVLRPHDVAVAYATSVAEPRIPASWLMVNSVTLRTLIIYDISAALRVAVLDQLDTLLAQERVVHTVAQRVSLETFAAAQRALEPLRRPSRSRRQPQPRAQQSGVPGLAEPDVHVERFRRFHRTQDIRGRLIGVLVAELIALRSGNRDLFLHLRARARDAAEQGESQSRGRNRCEAKVAHVRPLVSEGAGSNAPAPSSLTGERDDTVGRSRGRRNSSDPAHRSAQGVNLN